LIFVDILLEIVLSFNAGQYSFLIFTIKPSKFLPFLLHILQNILEITRFTAIIFECPIKGTEACFLVIDYSEAAI